MRLFFPVTWLVLAALPVTAGAPAPAAAGSAGGKPAAVELPAATPEKLPRWRGFNLLEKYSAEWSNHPFVEEDFRLIAKLGFNFVRLPLDYRSLTKKGDWRVFEEAPLKELDQAVAWGRQYGVHVCLNLHRAPGYCVNPPAEAKDLWTDPEALAVCAGHWGALARRYQGIPSNELSFNLLNEPPDLDPAVYARVIGTLAQAVRAEDPQRLIIADGLAAGSRPCPELLPLHVAQSTRGYQPFAVTHYRADWVQGADKLPVPDWPMPVVNAFLYGPMKEDLAQPLRLHGPFRSGTDLRIRVSRVSQRARLVIQADGRTVAHRLFKPGPGEGEWKSSVWHPQWRGYEGEYDLDVTALVPPGTKEVAVLLDEGDWLMFREIGLRPRLPGSPRERVLQPLFHQWALAPGDVRCNLLRPPFFSTPERQYDRNWLWEIGIKPWKELEARGAGVMVGEMGVFQHTPHDVALAWMRDNLENWKRAGWGWALWNFRGAFGVLDSGRADVAYEDWEGHKLDRKMLDLLQHE